MKAQIVSFHCVLKNNLGKVISSTFNHDVITQIEGAGGELLSGLVTGLQNLKKGEKRSIQLSASQAYGFYDPGLVIQVSKKRLNRGESIFNGQQVVTESYEGEMKIFRVVQAMGKSVTLDGNHPLAGQDLVFDIEATEAREATIEEIAQSRTESPNPYFH